MKQDLVVVRNVQNDQLYLHIEGNKFKNMVTGNEGEVTDEMAQKLFRINLAATQICNEFPNIQELIKRLNLKFDNLKTENNGKEK